MDRLRVESILADYFRAKTGIAAVYLFQPKLVRNVLEEHLGDIEQFAQQIRARLVPN